MNSVKGISFFIGPFGSGGGERNCCNLANAFVKRGIEVTVVAIGVKDPVFLRRFDPRVRFVNLGKKHLRHAIPGLITYLVKNRPAKVFAFNHYLGTALQLLRIFPQFNYTLHMRNIVGLTKKYRMNPSFWQAVISKKFVNLLLPQIDGIVSQCVDMKTDLVEHWLIPSERVKVIYNPVALEVEASLKPYDRSNKSQEILFVGRFSPEKGIPVLLRSLKSLHKSFPDLKVRLLGEGPMEAELKKLASDLGILNHVIFQGFVADPIPYYQRALVTALPSFSEGFPNVLIESLTLGTPVVAYDCETGPAEIILEGINGYLVELGDEAAFTDALHSAISKDWNFITERYRQDPIVKEYISFLGLDSE